MNSVIIDEIKEEKYIVSKDYKLIHILNNLSAKIGDELKITVIGKGTNLGKIIEINEEEIVFEKIDSFTYVQNSGVLIIGMSRPVIIKKILEHCSAMGIKKIIFFKAELTEKSYFNSKVCARENVNKMLELGLSQSGVYCDFPIVEFQENYPLNDIDSRTILLDDKSDKSFMSIKFDLNNYSLLIGPERGFSPLEVKKFNKLTSVKIADSILRVENATLTALGQIELLRLNS